MEANPVIQEGLMVVVEGVEVFVTGGGGVQEKNQSVDFKIKHINAT